MRHLLPLAAILTLMLVGCETTNKEAAPPPVQDLAFNYPKAIYVYDFAVAPAEVSYASVAAAQFSGATDDPDKTEKRDALEREIADAVATQLVVQLQELGLPAVRWRGTPPLNEDFYVIEGQFLTLGSNGVPDQKIVGFALGGGELRVLAQAYRVDGKQRKLLGEADVGSDSAAPGLATDPAGRQALRLARSRVGCDRRRRGALGNQQGEEGGGGYRRRDHRAAQSEDAGAGLVLAGGVPATA